MTDEVATTEFPPPKTHQRLTPKVLKGVVIILLCVIVVIVYLWKPWQANIKATDRTVSVTGNATLMAVPDQYEFTPSYDFTNTDQQAALTALSQQSSTIVAKLKALGVANNDIQTNANGSNNIYNGFDSPLYQGNNDYTLSLDVIVHDPTLAQKVQDYLVTTTPTGDVTPTVSFSTAKQQTLQQQARTKAEQDARAQAEQSAKNLGFKLGAVKSVNDNGQTNSSGPIATGLENGTAGNASQAAPAQLPVQPGQNEYDYSVDVVYFVR